MSEPNSEDNNGAQEDKNDSLYNPEQWRSYGAKKKQKLRNQFKDDLNFLKTVKSDPQLIPKVNQVVVIDEQVVQNDALTEEIEKILMDIYLQPDGSLDSILFKGVCIYVNGYTYPTADLLHTIMQITGGEYSVIFESGRTTHTIATEMSQAQLKSERAKKSTVRPEWIVDSLRARRLLPLDDYLLKKPSNGIKDFFTKIPKNDATKGDSKTISMINSKIYDMPCCSKSLNGEMSNSCDNRTTVTDEQKLSEELIGELDKSPEMVSVDRSPEMIDLSDCEDNIIDNESKTNDVLNQPNPEQSTSVTSFDASNYLPESLSQIDQGLLEALPKDIRDEIMASMNRKPNEQTKSKEPTENNVAKRKVKMRKDLTVDTLFNASTSRPRGRAALKKWLNTKVSGKSQLRIDTMIKHQRKRTKLQKVIDLYSGRDTSLGPNICGKTKLSDVCSIFNEWITTESDLTDQDISYVLRYFARLIDNNEIDKLFKILSQIKQFIMKLDPNLPGTDMWRAMFGETFQAFLASEQSLPKAKFNKKFFLLT